MEITLEIMPCSNFVGALPVENNLLVNTRCAIFIGSFFFQIVKKSEFDGFFTV
jgi:hypothetical protein